MFYYLVHVLLSEESYSFPIISEIELDEKEVKRIAEKDGKFEYEWDSYEAEVEEISEEEYNNWYNN